MRHVGTAAFDLDHNREYMFESLDEWEERSGRFLAFGKE